MESHFVLTTRFRAVCPIHRTARMTVVTDNRLGLSRRASLSEVMNTPSPSISANLVNGKPCRRGNKQSTCHPLRAFLLRKSAKRILHSPRTISPPPPSGANFALFSSLISDRCQHSFPSPNRGQPLRKPHQSLDPHINAQT